MKKILLTLALAVSAFISQAQSYDSALGVRINHGYGGVTYKVFTGTSTALDFTGYINFGNGFGVTGLYEIHKPVKGINTLNWYYGFGAHVGLYSDDFISQISLGVDGVVGIEWKPVEVPFAFSLDYIPSYTITNTHTKATDSSNMTGGFGFGNWTVGIKYTFGAVDSTTNDDEKK